MNVRNATGWVRSAGIALAIVLPPFAAWEAANASTGSHTNEKPICSTWKLRGTTGDYPNITFGAAPSGAQVTAPNRVVLKKPASGTAPGVEFASFNVSGVTGPATVKVHYALSEGATSAAGAIRVFGYEAQNANTITDAPNYGGGAVSTAVADGEDGWLTFELPDGESLGTLGMTYDSSNASAGRVVFRDMVVGKRKVSFETCPTASPSASASATPSATATGTASASASASTGAATPSGTGGPRALPQTGANAGMAAGVGAGVVVIGAALFVFLRRRRTRFEA